jgi:hypothetical protein
VSRAIAAAPTAIPAMVPGERLLDFPGDSATVVCVGLMLTVDVVGDEDPVEVADTIEGGVVGTPSRGKYSPGTKA